MLRSVRRAAARVKFVRDIYLAWNLAMSLFLRDLRGKYRRSMLGHAWAILQPLMFLGLWILLRSFFGIKQTQMPYAILLFGGMIPWSLFAGIINGSTPAIVSNSGIIKKMSVQREIFLGANTLSVLLDVLIMSLIFIVLLAYYRITPGWNILWAPFFLLLFGLFGFSIGLFVAAFGVFRSDITIVVTYILQIWMFLNPIIYPTEMVPENLRTFYYLNPTVPLLEGFRNAVVLNLAPDGISLIYSIVAIVVSLLISWPLFRRRAAYFADEL